MGVLRNASADRRLRRDGFVVMPEPLVSRETASLLRDHFLRMYSGPQQGFHADLTVDDPAYRRDTSDLIAQHLDERAVGLFDGYKVFLRNFLCKWPGDDSDLYLHRDWMYVDERGGDRTYVVWVPLEDITGHNGQLQVLRGSHRLDRSVRGTDLNASWIQHQEAIRGRLLSVPVPAGVPIVFDNALVHCSYPNLGGTPRVVAAIGMRPVDSRLVHYRSCGDDTADCWDVDEEFFLTFTPQALMSGESPVGDPTRLDAAQVTWSAAELARRLDRPPLARLDAIRRRLRPPADESVTS